MRQKEDSQAPPPAIEVENPEYVLLIVIGFLLWIVGFVNLLAEPSEKNPVVFGLYSYQYFTFIIGYGLGFAAWIALLFPRNTRRLKTAVAALQDRSWLAFSLLILLVGAIAFISIFDRFGKYPVFRIVSLTYAFGAFFVILFANWGRRRPPEWWRKAVAYPFAFLAAVELVMQALAFGGWLPDYVRHDEGLFVPYGRVYYSAAGLGNATTNRYGWYYPDLQLEETTRKIALIGGNHVQGLEVHPSQNLGKVLEGYLNDAAGGQTTEVLAFGLPGVGPGAHNDLTRYAIDQFGVDEVVIFINLGDDFQNELKADEQYISYVIDEEGEVDWTGLSFPTWHAFQHLVTRSHAQFTLWQTITSHYLTASVLADTVQALTAGVAAQPAASSSLDRALLAPQTNGFVRRLPRPWVTSHFGDWDIAFDLIPSTSYIFASDGSNDKHDAFTVTPRLIDLARAYAAENDVTFRLVTVPVFPDAFYAANGSGEWSSLLGEYDLFLPDDVIADYARAANVPMLSLGRHLQAEAVTPGELQELFFDEGRGYFTVRGHEHAAELLFSCFYAESGGSVDALGGEACMP